MNSPTDRPIIIRLSSQQAEQAELLEGLDTWLQLGLLSHEQVIQICREHLTCVVPTSPESSPQPDRAIVERTTEFAGDGTDFANAVPPRSTSSPSTSPPSSPRRRTATQPAALERWLQSFMQEISVIWLLVLGVFLVVVSSGVLAASQWQMVSPVGQYGILLTYTLAFFGVGTWLGRRQSLNLTARMLQITTLLIVPVNFWMIDGFGLWQSFAGVGLAAIAALTLTAITVFLLRPGSRLTQGANARLTALNCVALSWLHWGWALAGVPLVATYIGSVGTAILLFMQHRHSSSRDESPLYSNRDESPIPNRNLSQSPFAPATIVIALSTLLLVGRAILLANVPVSQLGLALGICGWLLCWITQPETRVLRDRLQIWTWAGGALVVLGWAVSVVNDPPWQALLVSGLALWLLGDRLNRWRQTQTLIALLLVGLQAYGLLWRIFPVELRQAIITSAMQTLGNVAMPEALTGVLCFPYVWLTLGTAVWLRRQSPPSPASPAQETTTPTNPQFLAPLALPTQADLLALILGLSFTIVSFYNPGARSLTLLLSACTLAWVVWKRPAMDLLIYLAHIAIVAAILSGIDWIFPDLNSVEWARVLLGMMTIEWGLAIGFTSRQWRRSAWYIGLGLAALSYILLLVPPLEGRDRMLVWLITPVLLTGIARLRRFFAPQLAAWLSTAALCAQLVAQIILQSSLNAWVVSWAIATGLMLVNTHTLRHRVAAGFAIGAGLALEVSLIWKYGADQITSEWWLVVAAITLGGLWLLRGWLVNHSTNLGQPAVPEQDVQHDLRHLYATALNSWAIALCTLTLVVLTLFGLFAISLFNLGGGAGTLPWQPLLAAGLTVGAILYRIWQQPTELGFYGLAWSVETLVVIGIARMGGSGDDVAIANLGLGLLTQIGGDVWVRRSGQPYRPSWYSIPLLYAGLGLLLAHNTFTEFTGLYTLAAALVGIGIGRRTPNTRFLTLLSLFLVSIAAYELLIYQLLQAEGGRFGDGIALMAGLAALIAWGDRLFSRGLLPYLRLTSGELSVVAHIHWAIGSVLVVSSIVYGLSSSSTVLLIGIAIALSIYALLLGRQNEETSSSSSSPSLLRRDESRLHSRSSEETWTYAGIVELLITIFYGLYEVIPDTSVLTAWAGAIASGLAIGMHGLPWQRWGWSMRPWRRSAAILPILVVALTSWEIGIQTLLITAAFYAWFAKDTRQIRLSYLSVFLLDWALLRFIDEQNWLNSLWFSALVGGSLLYIAQVDPSFQAQSSRDHRHWLRVLATGLICLTAFYQAEVETGETAVIVGFITLAFSLGLMFAGLLLRVRAFLYVGTVVFVIRILRWLWLFINSYSLLLWSVGILLGLIFIWIAATFEARRSQVNALIEFWSGELETWE